jgi:DNA-binding SARP family transcriptional activator
MDHLGRSGSPSAVGLPALTVSVEPVSAPVVDSNGLRVRLLGGFGLVHGASSSSLSRGSQRLLAFLALQGGAVRRDLTAGLLWPEASESRAHSSLRSGLARLGDLASGAVVADAVEVKLAASVPVDLYDSQQIARRLLEPCLPMGPAAAAAAIPLLSAELLPGWYEDWALLEAESWRQLRLHALEAAAGVLAGACRFGEAAAAAVAAVRADPLRESGHGALIAVHLAEGNQSEALREFERYRALLLAELGLEPTARLRAMLPDRHTR